ncbi:hypothetical protein ACSRUE_34050 [Sorangium sp. KYC3313]|uniref:hypothetical protein n=1 Tax=Sorangium sp. KYC3313 TaxID=3449740 RepID=UPI003F88EC82
MRWNDEKSRRFQALRAAEARGTLTDPERAELSRLFEDLDAEEADALRPAMELAAARAEDLAAQKAQLESQADALARIVAEQEGLLAAGGGDAYGGAHGEPPARRRAGARGARSACGAGIDRG